MKLKFLMMTLITMILGVKYIIADDNSSDEHTDTISIPEVALLDMEGSTAITLPPTAPKKAGEGFDFSTAVNKNVWINYLSFA